METRNLKAPAQASFNEDSCSESRSLYFLLKWKQIQIYVFSFFLSDNVVKLIYFEIITFTCFLFNSCLLQFVLSSFALVVGYYKCTSIREWVAWLDLFQSFEDI